MNLEITKEKVLEASKSSPEAKEALRVLFPEVFKKDHNIKIEPFECNLKIVDKLIGIGVGVVEPKFRSKCFILNDMYNWEIAVSFGKTILIPTTK